jgi:hypothetical protein
MKCPLRDHDCPAGVPAQCRGLQFSRFCELVDPTHPAYRPAYKRVLNGDDVTVPAQPPRPALTPTPPMPSGGAGGGTPRVSPCCGSPSPYPD